MDLSQANQYANNLVHRLPMQVEKIIISDASFFLSGLDKYSLTVCDDNDNEEKDEPNYGTILPLSFFKRDIKNVHDVAVHYVHVMGHKKCFSFWLQVNIPMSVFTKSELDFMEEMYNQRLISMVAPSLYKRFYDCFTNYESTRISKNPELRSKLNTVLTSDVDPDVPEEIRKIHKYLYSSDPLQLKTFYLFVRDWLKLVKTGWIKELIRSYDD